MKIKEILEIEKDNVDSIFLIKEGIFWRCYELSAFRFVKNIKIFQLTKKYIKNVNREIIYLGFPDSVLEQMLMPFQHIHKQESIIEMQGFEKTDGFEQWKSNIPLKTNLNSIILSNPRSMSPAATSHIIEKIKNYPIAIKTPMEVFEFLSKIQNEIYGKV